MNDFCLYISKRVTTRSNLIVRTYDKVGGNCVHLTVKQFFLMLNKASILSIATTDLFLTDHHVTWSLIMLGYHLRKHTFCFFYPATDLIYFTTPISLLINLSLMSIYQLLFF